METIKYLHLTNDDGDDVYINPLKILFIHAVAAPKMGSIGFKAAVKDKKERQTIIHFNNGSKLLVKEGVKEVLGYLTEG